MGKDKNKSKNRNKNRPEATDSTLDLTGYNEAELSARFQSNMQGDKPFSVIDSIIVTLEEKLKSTNDVQDIAVITGEIKGLLKEKADMKERGANQKHLQRKNTIALAFSILAFGIGILIAVYEREIGLFGTFLASAGFAGVGISLSFIQSLKELISR